MHAASAFSTQSDFGKYRLLSSLGHGGMGDVYLALAQGPTGFRKLVVLKLLRLAASQDPGYQSMFLEEGRLAARLSHPNVVQTHEVGSVNHVPYIAMEYLEGQPLSRVVRGVGTLPHSTAAHLIAEALAGAHYVHELCDFDGAPLGIVHRDLSPQNILITYDGSVKIVDFGIAKTTLQTRCQTEIGTFKGKLAYMAPEQTRTDPIDRRADVFALGAVLWELLAGRRLIQSREPVAALQALLHEPFCRLQELVPDIDPRLVAVVERALERDPEQRFASAAEMRQALLEYLDSAGHRLRPEAFGHTLQVAFAEQRHQIREQIQAAVAAAQAGHSPALPQLGEGAVEGSVEALESRQNALGQPRPTSAPPTAWTQPGAGSGVSAVEVPSTGFEVRRFKPRWRRIGLPAFCVVSFAVGWVSTRAMTHPPSDATHAPPASAAQAHPSGSASVDPASAVSEGPTTYAATTYEVSQGSSARPGPRQFRPASATQANEQREFSVAPRRARAAPLDPARRAPGGTAGGGGAAFGAATVPANATPGGNAPPPRSTLLPEQQRVRLLE